MARTLRTGVAVAGLITTAAAAVTVTGCSPSGPPVAFRAARTATTPGPGDVRPVNAHGATTPPPAATSSAHQRTTPSTATAEVSTTAPTVAEPIACPDGTVAVTAARGGAMPGEEIALLRFTNTSTSACSLTGFPGVELFANGAVVGRPAVRSSLPVRTLRLDPAATVTARLRDDSRCDAQLSDEVGIYVPNQTTQLTAPLRLRACVLTIDPVRN